MRRASSRHARHHHEGRPPSKPLGRNGQRRSREHDADHAEAEHPAHGCRPSLARIPARAEHDHRHKAAAEAESELAPFRSRMPQDAYDQSLQACLTRLVRERHRLPVLTFDP